MKRLLTQLSESYEFILVDLPPVNVVSDALAISPYLDGIIVVVREDYTDKKALKECVRQLQMANVKLLGFVLNQSKEDGKKYGKYYKKANT
jgi:Mrp family chromosome partitioning ATPase